MAGWIALTLWMSANSNAVQPTRFDHVRSAEAGIQNLIAEGYARSATFRELVDDVEDRPCIVYVSTVVKLSQGMRGALLHWTGGLDELPVLRVVVTTNKLARDEAISVIAHELQHVVEAVTASPAGRVQVVAAFDRLAPTARARDVRKYETDAAVAVTMKVREELRRAARRLTP